MVSFEMLRQRLEIGLVPYGRRVFQNRSRGGEPSRQLFPGDQWFSKQVANTAMLRILGRSLVENLGKHARHRKPHAERAARANSVYVEGNVRVKQYPVCHRLYSAPILRRGEFDSRHGDAKTAR